MKLSKYEKYRQSFSYFKVQWYDVHSKAWREAQKRFETEAQARKHGSAIASRHRVVKITIEGRSIV